MSEFKRLFFDIETSPCIGLFWRPGYKLSISHDNIVTESAIICICWKWQGSDQVYSLTWDNGDDANMLLKFVEVLKGADEIIAHNGDGFDEKWIRTRCLKHDIDSFPKYNSLDTLKKARTHFKFNSNRLDYIGKFLGFGGKQETGFGLWRDILLDNSEEAMDKMVEYCKRDVELLENVYTRLVPYIKHNTHVGVSDGGDKWSCPSCGGESVYLNKTRTTKMGTVRREMVCKDCRANYTVANRTYMEYLSEMTARKGKGISR